MVWWWPLKDSNLELSGYEPGLLPIEVRSHIMCLPRLPCGTHISGTVQRRPLSPQRPSNNFEAFVAEGVWRSKGGHHIHVQTHGSRCFKYFLISIIHRERTTGTATGFSVIYPGKNLLLTHNRSTLPSTSKYPHTPTHLHPAGDAPCFSET